jgi:serine phosphatase RsbU (regulator of sigma subunit)
MAGRYGSPARRAGLPDLGWGYARDIFVVLSDGVVDAERTGGERFGTARVIELVTRHCRSSAADLTAAPRDAVADFTGAARAEDDRTGLVVKRR